MIDGFITISKRRRTSGCNAFCEKALAIYKRALAIGVKEYLRGAVGNFDLATRANINLIVQFTRARYGAYSAEKAKLNFHAMSTIPTFQCVVSTTAGIKKMAELVEEREGWGNVAEIWTDGNMRSFLMDRVRSWPALGYVVGWIDSHPDMTYEDCKAQLMLVVDRLENAGYVATSESREMASRASPLYVQQTEVERAVGQTQDVSWYPDAHANSSTEPLYGAAANRWPPGCFNCHALGHVALDCMKLWCFICRGQ